MTEEATPSISIDFGNYPTTDIPDPHAHDVLCGRGGGTNNHIGNNHWRALVAANKQLYVALPKRQKMLLSRSIVNAVRSQNPPGRFLQKDSRTNKWHDVGDAKATEKTSQALREGAPVIRKKMENQQIIAGNDKGKKNIPGHTESSTGGRTVVARTTSSTSTSKTTNTTNRKKKAPSTKIKEDQQKQSEAEPQRSLSPAEGPAVPSPRYSNAEALERYQQQQKQQQYQESYSQIPPGSESDNNGGSNKTKKRNRNAQQKSTSSDSTGASNDSYVDGNYANTAQHQISDVPLPPGSQMVSNQYSNFDDAAALISRANAVLESAGMSFGSIGMSSVEHARLQPNGCSIGSYNTSTAMMASQVGQRREGSRTNSDNSMMPPPPQVGGGLGATGGVGTSFGSALTMGSMDGNQLRGMPGPVDGGLEGTGGIGTSFGSVMTTNSIDERKLQQGLMFGPDPIREAIRSDRPDQSYKQPPGGAAYAPPYAGKKSTSNLLDCSDTESDDDDDMMRGGVSTKISNQEWQKLQQTILHSTKSQQVTFKGDFEQKVPSEVGGAMPGPVDLNRDISVMSAMSLENMQSTGGLSRNISKVMAALGNDNGAHPPPEFERDISNAFSEMSLSRDVSLSGPVPQDVSNNNNNCGNETTVDPNILEERLRQYQYNVHNNNNNNNNDEGNQNYDGSMNNKNNPEYYNDASLDEQEQLEMQLLKRGASLAFEKWEDLS